MRDDLITIIRMLMNLSPEIKGDLAPPEKPKVEAV